MWEKIVLNLLSNAFKYTLKGTITVGLKQDDKHVIMTVEDTGVGIAEEELPHMFDRFHRIAGTAGRSYEGTGIGLSLVAELVKIHQGTIDVKSQSGVGTTFTIVLPTGHAHLPEDKVIHVKDAFYASANVDTFVSETVSLSPGQLNDQKTENDNIHNLLSATILVVDDNADMVKYLTRILEKNYRIITAANGKEALGSLSETTPDLVISDIMMPVMDGVQLPSRRRRRLTSP